MSRSSDDNGAPEIEIEVEIEHAGITVLARTGGRYRLEDSLGNGPTLKLNGRDASDSELGGWHAISAEKVAGGYLVAWKHDGSGLYSAWRTDDQGNYTGNVLGAVRGDDDGFRHLEDSLGHDLNDDRVVGLPHREIEHTGNIHLTQVGGHYELDDSLGNGPTLKLNGRDASESELGGWHAISAEKVAGGYLVAWKHDASGLYSAWRTDDQGNYTGNVLGAVRGDDDRLRHLEDDFGHDLNDDRVTGGLHREIEHAGTIHLTQIGARFYLSDDLGQGETLKLHGEDVLEGQLGSWHAIAAERTATGYQVAWRDDASGLYSVWNTDDRGAYTGNAIGAVRGDDDSFEAFETHFGQDLNGDHHDGVWHG